MSYLRSHRSTLDSLESEALPQLSHIIPGKLYPSYVASGTSNKLLDGTTSHSGAFGTAQSDGRSYYYTNIAGSKPIKDPRIGAHFGSQRHTFSSLQLLEHETATQEKDVFSIDGREWMRLSASAGNSNTGMENDSHGVRLDIRDNDYIEVVGYFNNANLLMFANASYDTFSAFIDGGTVQTTDNTITANSVLRSRYVNAGSLFNIPFNAAITSPGIHTLRIEATSEAYWYGIELIAQDTTSTATKSQIQIPEQNVVSAGKKKTVSGTPHYDPFNGFVNDTSLFSAFVDTATSLGLGTATTWGAAWDKGSSNHIRPYNGGRVVKWVDSGGTIKTSVNMMPANAQNVSATAAAEVTVPSATNTAFVPAFSNDAIDHSLAEVAKTFHWREFGNGAANQGNNTSGTLQDASMLNAQDAIGYVMDDGLTTISGASATYTASTGGVRPEAAGHSLYFTFIGTGITTKRRDNNAGDDEHNEFIDGFKVADGIETAVQTDKLVTVAQNLPYGTHVYAIQRTDVDAYNRDTIELTFHQPKMPPIPEDAVVLADYMLMADFVKQTDCEPTEISKGVRYCSGSRDHYGEAGSSHDTGAFTGSQFGITGGASSGESTWKLPFFGTTAVSIHEDSTHQLANISHPMELGGANTTETALDNVTQGNDADMMSITDTVTLGPTSILTRLDTGGYRFLGHLIVTPIHTSSHYQPFETPFTLDLVGGDRNMEQTNLVVTAEGKTWDEMTRDTSYIGTDCVHALTPGTAVTSEVAVIFENWRGTAGAFAKRVFFNKDFAIGYDRFICLVDGQYSIIAATISHTGNAGDPHGSIYINGSILQQGNTGTSGNTQTMQNSSVTLKRGDYVQIFGKWQSDHEYSVFWIKRSAYPGPRTSGYASRNSRGQRT